MEFCINDRVAAAAEKAESALAGQMAAIEDTCMFNSRKVLKAFIDNGVTYADFAEINGYGFFDEARDKIEAVFAQVLGTEDALVRPHIMSGTNAIWITLSGLLHPGDTLLAITGAPYDPLEEIVGKRGDSPLSLIRNGIKYEEIDLIGDDFDLAAIDTRLKKGGVSMVEIQRSCGYSHRRGLSLEKIKEACELVKKISPETIIMCDNCYGELVCKQEPTEVGVDVMAGSLMHNLGGGIATSGGYVAGRADLIAQVADRLTAPGIGKFLGANYNQNLKFLKGLYMAPRTVANAVKTAVFAAYLAEELGFESVKPGPFEKHSDLIQTFNLRSAEELIAFCQALQSVSPVDSMFEAVPCEMPGYPHDEIMSAGTFAQGSTIELTCDAPVVEPFRVYIQGGLTYEYGRIGMINAFSKILNSR